MIEVAVMANVECAHRDEGGRVHGHSYIVEVWFPCGPCLMTLNKFVTSAANVVDHTMLEDSVGSPRMEAVAAWFLDKLPASTRGVVRRPTLGFAAEARR